MHHALGNTISKLACDIIDTPATMSAKSHLRNDRPLVIAPSTNNGLSGNAENIGKLLNRRNYYFVPFRQDNPITKPRSIVFDPDYIVKTIKYALEGEQISPILLWWIILIGIKIKKIYNWINHCKGYFSNYTEIAC